MNLWFDEFYTDKTKFSIQVAKHIYQEKTPFQQIDFFDSEDFGRFFTLDGYMMVNEKDEFIYHDMIVHIPMAVNPHIKRVLVIGGGDGGTVRELTRYATIEHIDLVEIDERVALLCEEYLPLTACGLKDNRVNKHFVDGIEFIKNKRSQYDLIIVDSTDPIGPGEGLFTSAFYKDCHQALTEKGIMINQHESPYYAGDIKEMQKAHTKLYKTFEHCYVYQFHMPTYASGHWLFGFASKSLHPLIDHQPEKWEELNLYTKYYNSSVHKAAFALPTYVQELLKEVE